MTQGRGALKVANGAMPGWTQVCVMAKESEMAKLKLVSATCFLMSLGLSSVTLRGQTLADITGEFKGRNFHCAKDPEDSGVSQKFSLPGQGFFRVTTVYYPSAAGGVYGGVVWSLDGKQNWVDESPMSRFYYGAVATNYWELRSAGKLGAGKSYTVWYVYKIHRPLEWHVGVFPSCQRSGDGCSGYQYASNTRVIIEYSESGFTQPPTDAPPPVAAPEAPAVTSWPTDWQFVAPSRNFRYRYRFTWSGNEFTGVYVGLNNSSVFKGRVTTSGGETLIEYVQTDPSNPSYRATYKLKQVAPGKFTGTYSDYTGTFNCELTALGAPAPTGAPALSGPAPIGPAEPADVQQTTLQAGKRTARSGESVTVPIYLIKGPNLADMNFNLHYDVRVVGSAGQPSKGNLLDQAMFEANTKESGIVRLGFAQTSDLGAPGTGTVAQAPFKALGQPGDRTSLRLEVTTAGSAAGGKPAVATIDGEISIVGATGQVPGDSNGNGVLDMGDALEALKMSVQLIPVKMAADIDSDGRVTSTDARLIRQRVTGK
jgi:hypothetical protein